MKETVDLLKSPNKYIDEFKKEWLKQNYDFIESSVEKEKIKEFQSALLSQAIDDYYNLLEDFSYFPDPFKIFRAITIKDFDKFFEYLEKGEYLKDYEGLGIYWTWDEYSATPIWASRGEGEKAENIRITALINKDEVDWWNTILLNTDSSIGEEEKEIRLFKNSEIEIIEIEREEIMLRDLSIKAIANVNILNPKIEIKSEIKLKSPKFRKRIFKIISKENLRIPKIFKRYMFNQRRIELINDAMTLSKELKRRLGRFFIKTQVFGSFITNKPNPEDIDILLWISQEWSDRSMKFEKVPSIPSIKDLKKTLKLKDVNVTIYVDSEMYYKSLEILIERGIKKGYGTNYKPITLLI